VKTFDAGKTRVIGLPYCEKTMTMLSRFHLIPERNRQKDRFAISISCVSKSEVDKTTSMR